MPKEKVARIGWEDSIAVGKGFSSYLLEDRSMAKLDELVSTGFTMARNFVRSMNAPHRILLSFTKHPFEALKIRSGRAASVPGVSAMIKPGTYRVALDTIIFAEKALAPDARLDAFIGVAIHEVCHVLYSDFNHLNDYILKGGAGINMRKGIMNILEDNRIEALSKVAYPGLDNFIESAREVYFVMYYEEIVIGKRAEDGRMFTLADKYFQLFMLLIRAPHMVDTKDYNNYSDYLDELVEATMKPAVTPDDLVNQTNAVYSIISKYLMDDRKDRYAKATKEKGKEEKKKKMEDSEDDEDSESGDFGEGDDGESTDDIEPGDEGKDGEEESTRKSSSTDSDEVTEDESSDGGGSSEDGGYDAGEGSGKGEETSDEEVEEDPEPTEYSVIESLEAPVELSRKMLADMVEVLESTLEREVKEASISKATKLELLAEHTGEVISGGDSVYMFNVTGPPDSYNRIANKVSGYADTLRNSLKFQHRDYSVSLKSMRSGRLDVNKLAEAVQGVTTVYERIGKVKTDKVSVVLLIDQSYSMNGSKMEKAKDCAVLLAESLKSVPDVTLFIYGHSADSSFIGATEIYIYKELEKTTPFGLGSCKAINENRDGNAIRAVVDRVRTLTDNNIIMFMMSDGAPCARGYGGSEGINDVKMAVAYAEKKGVQIVSISIDASYSPERMFKHYVIFTDLTKLVSDVNRLAKKVIGDLLRIKTTY